MQKIITIMQALILAACFSQPASAATIDMKLEPHHSQGIENSYAFTINATCTITVKSNHNKIRFNVTKNKGSINGKTLTNGQSTSITVENQDQIIVHAEPDTKVTVYNLGDSTVHANCSV